MKFVPIAFSALAILAVPFSGITAKALAEPIEVTAPAGEEPGNQVLEIPQSCDQEGSEIPCDQLSQNAAAEDAAAVADGTLAPADPLPQGSSAEMAAGGVGSQQEYQNQGSGYGMAAAPFGAIAPEPYARTPVIVGNPIVVGPFVGAGGPFIPRVMPAPGPIVSRPAWLLPPSRPMMPMTTMRPMVPAGMPQMFRLR